MSNVLDCGLEESEFGFQSHFMMFTLDLLPFRKAQNTLIPSSSDGLISITAVLLQMLDIDWKTLLISVDAVAEVRPWLNENNRKCTWYLKYTGCICSQRKCQINCVDGIVEGDVSTFIV